MTFKPMIPKDTGNSISASEWNQIGDNFTAGIPDAMTTKGDIVTASGIDAGVRLPAGMDGSYYWADSGASGGISSSLPAKLSAKPTGGNSQLTRLAWTSASWLTSENFDLASAYSAAVFTVPHSGYFLIGLGIAVYSKNTGVGGTSAPFYVAAGLLKNGVFHVCLGLVDITDWRVIEGDKVQVYGQDILKLVKGDTITPAYYINTNAMDNPNSDTTTTLARFELAPLI